jgi:hypothetical protein
MSLRPINGAPGEYIGLTGVCPYNCEPKPNCQKTFRHPCTGQCLNVPLRLPLDSTPNIEHRRDRVIYNYGSYTVEIDFLPDGSVNVIYNSGLMRAVNPG